MTKRKSSASKTKATKIAKVEKDEKSEIVESKDDTIHEAVETNEEKMNKFKRKLGMVKDGEDDKDWVKGNGYLVYTPSEIKSSEKIASFDLDGTLIDTKSGKKFAEGINDWKIKFNEIPSKLKTLENDGYKLVIFTNQGGIEKGKVKAKDFKKKINAIIEELAVKIQVIVATNYSSVYRKPNTGMFELLEKEHNSGVKINCDESLYVGDAAGRIADWAPQMKKDFSNSDRLFALNCHLKFYTPEAFFLQKEEGEFKMPDFNPAETVKNCQSLMVKYDKFQKSTSDIQDCLPKDSSEVVLIIMVGYPGSGKSTFCRKHLQPLGFNVINRDTLKTWQKCVSETQSLFNEKKNVVIDNTNPDVATRDRYISVAIECGVKHIICCIMDISEDQAKHNEHFRQLTSDKHDHVSEMVFKIHKNKYVEPTETEKFTEICKIVPALEFENDDHKCIYSKFLLEK